MWGKLFSKKKESFYLPGEEIRLDKSFSFNDYSCERDPLNTCKNRVAFAMFMFVLVYCVMAVRLFDLCILSAAERKDPPTQWAENNGTYAVPESPIKRADIVDRNGTIIATSLPTVNLFANPKKIMNPKRAAEKLAAVLPDITYEDLLAKLTRRGSFVYIKRNLSPSQQYQINALGIPGLEFEDGEQRNCLNHGSTPILLETGTFSLAVRTEKAGKMTLYALGLDGRRLERIPVRKTAGGIEFTLRTAEIRNGPSLYFELIEE